MYFQDTACVITKDFSKMMTKQNNIFKTMT